jgi:Tfp pilus assembly protein PilF
MRIPGIAALAALLVLAACTSSLRRHEAAAPAPVLKATPSVVVDTPTPTPARPPVQEAPAPAKKPETPLAAGISAYENGDYATAQQKLQTVLDQGGSGAELIAAHKYLAFIWCATGKRDACESHFRQILALDRSFTLGPAEAGHPVWGPVFRKLKAAETKKTTAKK